MLKSMTAYGRAQSKRNGLELIVEMRSVNYRYREIILRIPQNLQLFEHRIKELVSSSIKRGRVEVSIQIGCNNEDNLMIELNRPLLKSYVHVFNELKEELGSKQPLDMSFFSQLKDIFLIRNKDVDLEEIWPDLDDVIRNALISLDAMRVNEGKMIEKDFLERLNKIAEYINKITQRSDKIIDEYFKKLEQNIKKLIENIEISDDRLMQEVAFMAEKSDITEEVIRLESHLKQFKIFMNKDDIIGRRLDFLLQEINREINTIGSKASDSLVSHYAVEIKVELEKLREQIQNVE